MERNQTYICIHFSWYFLRGLCFNFRIISTSTGLKPQNWCSRLQWALWWDFSGSLKDRVLRHWFGTVSFLPPPRDIYRAIRSQEVTLWWQIPIYKRKQTVFCRICESQPFSGTDTMKNDAVRRLRRILTTWEADRYQFKQGTIVPAVPSIILCRSLPTC